ncbi:MAG: MOSC domain-containing protein [Gammaproteobacteria bacterium]|nr:MOSC domain-containing protein [Gammaproteobacteria bacterium]
MSGLSVSELYIHPVKSLASLPVDSAMVDQFGLTNDRRWMLVDTDGVFITQRFIPSMCLITALIEHNRLRLTAANMPAIYIDEKDHGAVTMVTVWNDRCQALDCGDAVADWLSRFLKKDCRLVYFPQHEVRQVDLDYAKAGDKTGFSDGFPLLLISQASLDDLNSRLTHAVAMPRFRPNIVISGCEAFAEDQWQAIRIGDLTYRLVKPCSRCSIPGINPLTAQRETELLQTLRSYRMKDNKVYFGQNVIADNIGLIKKGMAVELIG